MTHEEMKTIMRDTLLSKGLSSALRAMTFAETFHRGQRKDGSHEFSHQLEMAEMILRLPDIDDLDATLAVCFLHDVREDYSVADAVLRRLFGHKIAHAVDLLTKEFGGVRIEDRLAYSRISSNPIAAIVKGVDRTHNLSTMEGAFSPLKQREYLQETTAHIRPMILRARSQHSSCREVLTHILARLDRSTALSLTPAQALT